MGLGMGVGRSATAGRRRRSYDRKKTAPEREAEQRARILEAAVAAYSAKGYLETKVGDITARAEVSRRTLYTHFPSIDDVRFAVYEYAVGRTLAEVMGAAVVEDASDTLAAALGAAFRVISESPELARVVAYELRLPRLRNIELRDRIVSFLASVLHERILQDFKNGRGPHAPDELTVYALVGAMEALFLYFLDRSESMNPVCAVPVLLRVVRDVYPLLP
jgi:AcrR family transcriptional regulator